MLYDSTLKDLIESIDVPCLVEAFKREVAAIKNNFRGFLKRSFI